MPLSNPGPHFIHGWGQVVRLRHLYAIRTGQHLLISGDGHIRGSSDQSEHSLLAIRPLEPGSIVFSGVATSHFLCMQGDGTLYSSLSFSSDDCTFQELILPDGHNVYSSASHRVLLSLGRRHGEQFLPRTSTLDQTLSVRPDVSPLPSTTQTEAPLDTMDSFEKMSQIIHSPSFHKR